MKKLNHHQLCWQWQIAALLQDSSSRLLSPCCCRRPSCLPWKQWRRCRPSLTVWKQLDLNSCRCASRQYRSFLRSTAKDCFSVNAFQEFQITAKQLIPFQLELTWLNALSAAVTHLNTLNQQKEIPHYFRNVCSAYISDNTWSVCE